MLYYHLDFYSTLLLLILMCFIKFTVCCINEKNRNKMCFVMVIFVLIGQSHKIFDPFLGQNSFWASYLHRKNINCYFLCEKFINHSFFCTKIYKYLISFYLFFIFRGINVYFLPKKCKLLLFHNIFLLFCNCNRRIKERKRKYMRQIGNKRKKPKKKRKQL